MIRCIRPQTDEADLLSVRSDAIGLLVDPKLSPMSLNDNNMVCQTLDREPPIICQHKASTQNSLSTLPPLETFLVDELWQDSTEQSAC